MKAQSSSPTRRQLMKGAVWSAPAVIAAATVPAYASSKKGTATTTAGQYFRTVIQTDSKTLTMTFSAASWDVSTSVAGTGDATGVFIQFKVTDACLAAGALTVTGQTTMTYTDAVGTKTMTKNTGPTSI